MLKKLFNLIKDLCEIREDLKLKTHWFDKDNKCLFCGKAIEEENNSDEICPQAKWNRAIVNDKVAIWFKMRLFAVIPLGIQLWLVDVKRWMKVPLYTHLTRLFKRKLR